MLSSPWEVAESQHFMWPHLCWTIHFAARSMLQDPQEVVEQVQRIQQLMQEEVNALPGPVAG